MFPYLSPVFTVKLPILNRLCNMRSLNLRSTLKVGNRPGYLEHTAIGTHAESHALHSHMENGLRFLCQQAILAGQLGVKLRIAVNAILPISGLLQLPGFAYSLADLG